MHRWSRMRSDQAPTTWQRLVAQLRGDDLPLRVSAAQRLAIFRDPAAAPALAECLADAERELRVAAALALAACGTRDSVPPLLEALTDPDPLVAQAAAVALENLTGHAEAFNAFVPAENATATPSAGGSGSPTTPGRRSNRNSSRGWPAPTATSSAAPPWRWATRAATAACAPLRRILADTARHQSVPGMEEDPPGRRHPLQLARGGQSADAPGGDAGARLPARHGGRAAAGRDAGAARSPGHRQPVPGRGRRGGPRAHRHAGGRSGADRSLRRAGRLSEVHALVRRSSGADGLPRLAGPLLHRRSARPARLHAADGSSRT